MKTNIEQFKNPLPVNTLDLMKSTPRWVLCKIEKDGSKPPCNKDGYRHDGSDEAVWMSYEEAFKMMQYLNIKHGAVYGIGFVLGYDKELDGNWQGVDLDNIIENGLKDIADSFYQNSTWGYVERSPSGTGAHVIGFGKTKFDNLPSDGSGIEAYCEDRYFTFTGKQIRNDAPVDLAPYVEWMKPRRKVVQLPTKAQTVHDGQGVKERLTEQQWTHLESALEYISSDVEPEWFAVLGALKSVHPLDLHRAKELARDWSKRSKKYNDEAFEAKWSRSDLGEKNGFRNIFDKAAKYGWTNPAKGQDREYFEAHGLELAKAFLPKLNALRAQSGKPPLAFAEDGTLNPLPVAPNASRFARVGMEDLLNQPATEWRVKGMFPAQGVVTIYGAPKSGKSFLALELGAAIAEGKTFFPLPGVGGSGFKTKQAPVTFLALEGKGGYAGRVKAWKIRHGGSFPEGAGAIFPNAFNIANPQDIADLAAALPKKGVVFIDTLTRAMNGSDMNSLADMGKAIAGADELARLTEGLVVLIAHAGKDASKGMLGASNLPASAEAVLLVRRKEDGTRSFSVEFGKDVKDGEFFDFALSAIEVGRDEDGDAITSCYIEPVIASGQGVNADSKENGKSLPKNEQEIFDAYLKSAEEYGDIDGQGVFIGVLDYKAEGIYEASSSHKKETKDRYWRRYPAKLVEKGLIKFVGSGEKERVVFGENAQMHNITTANKIKARKAAEAAAKQPHQQTFRAS